MHLQLLQKPVYEARGLAATPSLCRKILRAWPRLFSLYFGWSEKKWKKSGKKVEKWVWPQPKEVTKMVKKFCVWPRPVTVNFQCPITEEPCDDWFVFSWSSSWQAVAACNSCLQM